MCGDSDNWSREATNVDDEEKDGHLPPKVICDSLLREADKQSWDLHGNPNKPEHDEYSTQIDLPVKRYGKWTVEG